MNSNEIIKHIKPLLYLLGIIWIVFAISFIFPQIRNYGIIPRNTSGLAGIVFSPLLHENLSHIFANSVGLLILGGFLSFLEGRRTTVVMAVLVVLSGLGTWIIGRSGSVHIGASGLIYGILGFLIVAGIFRRDVKSVILSIVVFFLYGGMIFGVLPVKSFVSWEGHLCGLLSGVLLAWFISRKQ